MVSPGATVIVITLLAAEEFAAKDPVVSRAG